MIYFCPYCFQTPCSVYILGTQSTLRHTLVLLGGDTDPLPLKRGRKGLYGRRVNFLNRGDPVARRTRSQEKFSYADSVLLPMPRTFPIHLLQAARLVLVTIIQTPDTSALVPPLRISLA